MIVTLVYVQVKPGHIEEFIEASRLNHENSIKEDGNLRFDIIQEPDDPGSFIIYEVFRDDEAIAAHKASNHYLEWREKVEPWMAVKRTGVRYNSIFPKDENLW